MCIGRNRCPIFGENREENTRARHCSRGAADSHWAIRLGRLLAHGIDPGARRPAYCSGLLEEQVALNRMWQVQVFFDLGFFIHHGDQRFVFLRPYHFLETVEKRMGMRR